MNAPEVEPINVKAYTVKQSANVVVGKLPIRSISLGPSGSEQTVLLQNLIFDLYIICSSRIYVFSLSINEDISWLVAKKYI